MNSHFRRTTGKRRYKRMFVIVAEGTVTEHEYFDLLNGLSIVHVDCLENRKSLTPEKALKRVREYIQKESLRKNDEAWVVVDRDSWQEEHFSKLSEWSQTRNNYGFALSNPKFELWLLLHFEDATGIANGSDCDRKLHKYLPHYNKHIDISNFTRKRIKQAIQRARQHDTPPCKDWPRNAGSTTVYRLVERILQPNV